MILNAQQQDIGQQAQVAAMQEMQMREKIDGVMIGTARELFVQRMSTHETALTADEVVMIATVAREYAMVFTEVMMPGVRFGKDKQEAGSAG